MFSYNDNKNINIMLLSLLIRYYLVEREREHSYFAFDRNREKYNWFSLSARKRQMCKTSGVDTSWVARDGRAINVVSPLSRVSNHPRENRENRS